MNLHNQTDNLSFKPDEFPVAKAIDIVSSISYSDGSVVSRTLKKNDAGTVTLFSFDTGQGLSEHSAPFDAIVQILDGEAELTIGGKKITAVQRNGSGQNSMPEKRLWVWVMQYTKRWIPGP
jgi:hypothetical protein